MQGWCPEVSKASIDNEENVQTSRSYEVSLFAGELPAALASMTNLTFLDLSDNQFSSKLSLLCSSALETLETSIVACHMRGDAEAPSVQAQSLPPGSAMVLSRPCRP
jgi:Leucine-rich repeat (LRR) protein